MLRIQPLLLVLALSVFPALAQPPGTVKPTIAHTITLNAYADNWCVIFINGKMVAVDSIDFLPHNQISVKILPEYPMTIAVLAKDNADPATGLEYGNQIGDAGFILKHATGNLPHGGEIDGPIAYADYYFLEALTRAKAMRELRNHRTTSVGTEPPGNTSPATAAKVLIGNKD